MRNAPPLIVVLLVFCIGASLFCGTVNSTLAENEGKVSKHVYFNKKSYSFGQRAIVFLLDKNLDRHHDGIDSYKPQSGFVFLEIGGKRVSDNFTKKVFQSSFMETGTHTGIFKAKLKIPVVDETGKSTKGQNLTITYVDVINGITWRDTATIL
jgi:hypothetical protein